MPKLAQCKNRRSQAMNEFATAVWPRIHIGLNVLSQRVHVRVTNLKHELRCGENDYFLLMAYLAFAKPSDKNEIALTIDIQVIEGTLKVVSDLCFENGEILANGPSAQIAITKGNRVSPDLLNEWFDQFERFLNDVEERIVSAAMDL
jgi:hypothetical protein